MRRRGKSSVKRLRAANMVIGQRIRALRKAMGMSARVFAEAVGTSGPVLNNVELGWNGLRPQVLEHIRSIAVDNDQPFQVDDIVLVHCDRCTRTRYVLKVDMELPGFERTCMVCRSLRGRPAGGQGDGGGMQAEEMEELAEVTAEELVEVVPGCKIYPSNSMRTEQCMACDRDNPRTYDVCLTHAAVKNWPGWEVWRPESALEPDASEQEAVGG